VLTLDPAVRAQVVDRVLDLAASTGVPMTNGIIATDPGGCFGAIHDAYMAKRAKLRLVDLWIQALTEATEDEVIAAAVRLQIREVHDFFADVIRDGQERGVVHRERDPVAEAWIFVAGGLLATMDSRLGGLLGGDLQRVRESRRSWMLAEP